MAALNLAGAVQQAVIVLAMAGGIVVGFVVPLFLHGSIPGFRAGISVGAVFAVLGSLFAGSVVVAIVDGKLGTTFGLPLGIFLGCAAGGMVVNLIVGAIGSAIAYVRRPYPVKFQFSLRTFLIVCAGASLLLALVLGQRWQPRYHSGGFSLCTTAQGTQYRLHTMTKVGPYHPRELLSAVIIPAGTIPSGAGSANRPQQPTGSGVEIYPNGVFLNRRLIGGYGSQRVVIVLSKTDVRAIELSEEEIKAINTFDIWDATMPPNLLSNVWREKVEPEIDRLVDERNSPFDRAYLKRLQP